MHETTDDVLFHEQATLAGERTTLRPFTDEDIDAMGTILADPEVNKLTGGVRNTADTESRPPGLDEQQRQWYETRSQQKDRLDLAIIDNDTGKCVGEGVLNHWRPLDETLSFRILIGPTGRNRGLGSEATSLLIDHAFQATNINRLELEVYAFNPRAHRVYEKAGFILEGRQRQVMKFDDDYIDVLQMSMLRSDWSLTSAGTLYEGR